MYSPPYITHTQSLPRFPTTQRRLNLPPASATPYTTCGHPTNKMQEPYPEKSKKNFPTHISGSRSGAKFCPHALEGSRSGANFCPRALEGSRSWTKFCPHVLAVSRSGANVLPPCPRGLAVTGKSFAPMPPRSRGQKLAPMSSRSRGQNIAPMSSRSRGQNIAPMSSRSRGQNTAPMSSRSRGQNTAPMSSRSRGQNFTLMSSRSRGRGQWVCPHYVDGTAYPGGNGGMRKKYSPEPNRTHFVFCSFRNCGIRECAQFI